MTEFSDSMKLRCYLCGTSYEAAEGRNCDCWRCEGCGGEYSDGDMCGDKEKGLCLHCVDMKFKGEVQHE